MKKLLALASIMSTCVIVSQASAAGEERFPRWYVGLSGGMAFLDDSDISGGATGNMEYQDGAIATLALGYMPPGGWQPFTNMRLEAEFGYHSNDIDSLVLSGTPTATSSDVKAYSYMANMYYDFHNTSRFTPYVGGGLGAATVKLSKNSGLGNTDDSDTVFAYQFMLGIGFAPASMPLTEWTLGYRYFAAQDPEFSSAGADIALDDYASSNIELGGKFRF